MFGKSNEKIIELVESLNRTKNDMDRCKCNDGEFNLTVEKYIEKILGVDVSQWDNNVARMQSNLIERIIQTVGFHDKQVHCKTNPSAGILLKD